MRLNKRYCALLFLLVSQCRLVDARATDETEGLLFGTASLHIPTSLGAAISPPKKPGGYAAINIFTSVLDLHSRPLGMEKAEAAGNYGWVDQLTILIQYPEHGRDSEDVLKDTLRNSHRDESDFKTMNNGCRLYDNLRPIPMDAIVCVVQNHEIMASCRIKKGFITSPSCTVMKNLPFGATITYSFSKDYNEELPIIDRNINELYASFFK